MCGLEGTFRIGCQEFLRQWSFHAQTFLSLLSSLEFSPLVDWTTAVASQARPQDVAEIHSSVSRLRLASEETLPSLQVILRVYRPNLLPSFSALSAVVVRVSSPENLVRNGNSVDRLPVVIHGEDRVCDFPVLQEFALCARCTRASHPSGCKSGDP